MKAKLQEKFENLIKQADSKIHFKYFIHEDLLMHLNLITAENSFHKEGTHRITLKFSNKFNPAILPKIASLIDPIFKWRNENPNQKNDK